MAKAALFAILLSLLASAAQAHDSADGLAGGPDYWMVTNLCLSPKPVLHEAPDPQAKRLAYLAIGTIVKNHGCRMAHRQRWCSIETGQEPGLQGWILGHCLREAPAPQSMHHSSGREW